MLVLKQIGSIIKYYTTAVIQGRKELNEKLFVWYKNDLLFQKVFENKRNILW